MNFYNDNDPYVAQWLGNLIEAGHLPQGAVDARSIAELCEPDVSGYAQCHFFAGIGGWPLALQMAGWPTTRPVWTGSCPCQPFSAAGKRKGTADERHLWPEFRRLISECRPATIFGEQVASRAGREWLAGVRADLEALGYAVGAADLCAAGEGAPHIRQRLFWVADAESIYGSRHPDRDAGDGLARSEAEGREQHARRDGPSGGVADSEGFRWPGEKQPQPDMVGHGFQFAQCGTACGGLGDAESEQMGGAGQSWQDSVWLPCLDGKERRIEPGTFPLAHGVPARVGRLRGYGNAIVPQIAAAFIRAFLEC
jgi:DNA (cytosine-5)-methyltransferase 1